MRRHRHLSENEIDFGSAARPPAEDEIPPTLGGHQAWIVSSGLDHASREKNAAVWLKSTSQMYHERQQRLAQRASLLELPAHQREAPQEASEQHGHQEADELLGKWKATIALFLTIAGIGILTASWLVVTTLNCTLYETVEAAVNFVGLAVSTHQRGTRVCSRGQSSRCGHERVRTHLYLATLTAARFIPIIKGTDERLRAAGKASKGAQCACARKLLPIAFAVATHEHAFDPHYPSVLKAETAVA